jgi:hypothetical protein
MMEQTKGSAAAGRTHGRNPAKIDSGASAHLARQTGGLRTAGSAHRRQHVSARGAIGALERLRWTGSVHAVAHQASWTPHGGSSPRAGAALHCFYCCDRGSTQLGVGEIPAQQCGGLQVADLAERSGVP